MATPCTILRACLCALGLALLSLGASAQALDQIKLPPGFGIELWARVENARQMALGTVGPNGGTLFVGSTRAGKVHAVRFDAGFKARPNGVSLLASNIQMPAGVAFKDGDLYISAVSRILRIADVERQPDRIVTPTVVTDKFPSETHHGWKFIAFGPDGKLYVPVGAPCNVCDPDSQRYANIMRMNADGSGLEVVARGVRNTVGFDWQPGTRELWFTDNGRDMLGDDVPPDELNRAARAGLHFGYPYCHAGDIADPEFGAKGKCADYTPPAQKLGPHVAALGMRFYTGSMFPPAYRGNIFIAEHGSWNRSNRIGYRVTRAQVGSDGRVTAYEAFATGWLQGDNVSGRPADVQMLPDGSLLVADDYAGAIYRISYRP